MKFFQLLLIFFISSFLASCVNNKSSLTSQYNQPENIYDTKTLKSGNLVYRVSNSWQKTSPSNPMRLEEYIIDPTTQTKLAVHYFEGMAGNIDANLQRWQKQFKQDEYFEEVEKTQFNKDGMPITVYHVAGTFLEPQNPMDPSSDKTAYTDFAMIATAVELKDGTWFFKAYGPKNVIEGVRPRFDELIKTFKVEE